MNTADDVARLQSVAEALCKTLGECRATLAEGVHAMVAVIGSQLEDVPVEQRAGFVRLLERAALKLLPICPSGSSDNDEEIGRVTGKVYFALRSSNLTRLASATLLCSMCRSLGMQFGDVQQQLRIAKILRIAADDVEAYRASASTSR